MKQFVKKVKKIAGRYITDSGVSAVFSETREMDTSPSRDMERVSAAQRTGNFGSGAASREMKNLNFHQKTAEAVIGESRLEQTILDSNSSIANSLLKSSEGVDSFLFPGSEGNRTPETHLSRIVSFQTGPRVRLL